MSSVATFHVMARRDVNLLARAGVDLTQPDTVRAVAAELDLLVGRLEEELQAG